MYYQYYKLLLILKSSEFDHTWTHGTNSENPGRKSTFKLHQNININCVIFRNPQYIIIINKYLCYKNN